MTSELRPYSAYKASGAEWRRKVPEHWNVRKLRGALRLTTERNRPELPLLSVVREQGIVLRDVTNKDENHNYIPDDLTNYKVVQRGHFAINKMKAWQGSYGVSKFDGIVSPAYFVFTVDGVDGDFFHTAIRSQAYVPYFTQASDGVRIGQWDLSLARLREIPFSVPPLPEQAAIVRFLDHVDLRIQRYIRAKQKLIALLDEQKQVVIHQAVTGQIDVRTGRPYLAYKDSGVEWLEEVPEHWEVRRLKTLSDMRSGDAITAISIEGTGEYPVYGGNGMRGYTSSYTHDGNFVLIGRQGALCGNVHMAHGRFWASEHAVVAKLQGDHILDWLGALLTVMNLNQYSIAAAQPGLSIDRVLNLWAPVPPLHEQNSDIQVPCYAAQRFTGGCGGGRATDCLASRIPHPPDRRRGHR